MRITDSILASNLITSLNKSKESINSLQNQIATNSKINKPSDSPSGISRVLRLDDQIANIDTFKSNIDNSLAFAQTSIDSMQAIQDEIEKINVMFTDINNPTNQSSFNTYGDKIDLAIKSLVDLANAEYDGKYVFGGTDFSKKPFDFSSTTVVNPATGQNTTTVMQNVNTQGVQNVRISTNIIQKINTTGQEVFGTLPNTGNTPPDSPNLASTDIFNTLIRVRDNLKSGQKPANADIQIVKKFGENLLVKTTSAGEIQNRLDSTSDMLDNQKLELQNLLSKEKDTDVAKAVIDLQNQQYFLEMSYKMASMTLPKSLLDYL
ncbi:MAG: flagellin [Bacteroidota bacterium]|nr:flagellin [Bacteroidota bacterium]MDP4190181.1 flagellin [Bacteroidota bacterium]MDP4193780.1 flagellin [Bacteroidota bacterium]